jgi:outer membrane receptor protein involved in Fe transport
VLLPTSDEDKRAVELDQFPAEVIESLQVSKTFTPDQQGNASGGAVNVVLKGVPDDPLFLKWKTGTSYNSQVTGRSTFLTYDGGGVHAFGKSGAERNVQALGENWDGAVGSRTGEAPVDGKGSLAGGGRFDLGGGWRAGGFFNVFYERDSSAYANGRDDSLWALRAGDPLTPQFSQGTPQSGEFYTSLLDVAQSKQSASWGGLGTFGVADKDHAVTLAWLFTQSVEDTVTRAEDTRGKQYFFPGHDPEVPTSPGFEQLLGAPYLRLQTLTYVERATETLQLNGRHRFEIHGAGPLRAMELDWTLARSSAERDEPDKRQFSTAWNPNGVYLQFKPAAQFTLGNLQRTFERIVEDSEEARLGLKLPFEVGGGRKGSLRFGAFADRVDRTFVQETFSNFSDPNFFFPGQFDELDWTQSWQFQDHPISASETDVDYRGTQDLTAGYAMLELPLTDWAKLIGGVRIESTRIEIVNDPEAQASWIPPGQFGTATLLPGDGDVAFAQQDMLPSVGFVFDPLPGLTLRAAYNETVARQTFKELTPIFQQEYLGGPVFVGNPDLEMSAVRNFDLRADYTPIEGSLLSMSWFRKDIEDPIEYVEKVASYSFTTAVNYPRGTLSGIELEARQALGELWKPLDGFGVGANSTWIEATVRLPDSEINQFEALQGVRPRSIRDMTNAPEYLYNLFATWDLAATKTSFGLFYTVTGDTLVQGPGPSNDFFVPATYETRYESLSLSVTQALGSHVKLSLAGKNLTDALRREVYRSEFIADDVTRRSYTDGVEWSLTIGGEIRF